MATKFVEKTVKNAYKITITHVGKSDKGKDVIYTSTDIRTKFEDEVKAFAFAIRDASEFAGVLDESSIDQGNPVTAIVRFPDASFAYIAINLSDTQCPTCGAPDGHYNDFCPTCQQRKKDADKRGSGSKANALFAALSEKDTRRGRS